MAQWCTIWRGKERASDVFVGSRRPIHTFYLSAIALNCPADVIKTRMMNQATGKGEYRTVYRSSCDCLVKTVKSEGVHALWKCFIHVRPCLAKKNYYVRPVRAEYNNDRIKLFCLAIDSRTIFLIFFFKIYEYVFISVIFKLWQRKIQYIITICIPINHILYPQTTIHTHKSQYTSKNQNSVSIDVNV